MVPRLKPLECAMPKFLKEPFVHFVLVGAALYLLNFALLSNRPGAEAPATQIVMTADIEAALAEEARRQLTATDGSPLPTDERFDNALAEVKARFIRNEIFYREGVLQGLDLNDPVIKDRVVAKLEVLAAERASVAPITEQALQDYYQAHKHEFAWATQVDLWQVFYSKARGDAESLQACEIQWQRTQTEQALDLNALAAGADRSTSYRLDLRYLDKPQLVELFGAHNAANILAVNGPGWLPPFTSPAGCHLIKVTAIRPGGQQSFVQVKDEIARKIEAARNNEALDNYYAELQARYQVITQ